MRITLIVPATVMAAADHLLTYAGLAGSLGEPQLTDAMGVHYALVSEPDGHRILGALTGTLIEMDGVDLAAAQASQGLLTVLDGAAIGSPISSSRISVILGIDSSAALSALTTGSLGGGLKSAEDLAVEARAAERNRIKGRRNLALVTGTTVGGMPIATDDTSQSRITGAALAVTLDPQTTIQWKTGGGFVVLDAATVIAIAQAVRAHVQACFDREAELLAALEAGEVYDAESGWP